MRLKSLALFVVYLAFAFLIMGCSDCNDDCNDDCSDDCTDCTDKTNLTGPSIGVTGNDGNAVKCGGCENEDCTDVNCTDEDCGEAECDNEDCTDVNCTDEDCGETECENEDCTVDDCDGDDCGETDSHSVPVIKDGVSSLNKPAK
jgi:hypothetical protein